MVLGAECPMMQIVLEPAAVPPTAFKFTKLPHRFSSNSRLDFNEDTSTVDLFLFKPLNPCCSAMINVKLLLDAEKTELTLFSNSTKRLQMILSVFTTQGNEVQLVHTYSHLSCLCFVFTAACPGYDSIENDAPNLSRTFLVK